MTDLNKHHDDPFATQDAYASSFSSASNPGSHAPVEVSTDQPVDRADPAADAGRASAMPIVTMPVRPASLSQAGASEEPTPDDPDHAADAAEPVAATPSKKKVVKKKKAVTKKVAKRASARAASADGDDDEPGDDAASDSGIGLGQTLTGSREVDGPTVKNRLVINYVPGEECRVAVVYDDRLEELHAEKAGANTIVGNIYVGKVTNVEASMQAAFVDFGHGVNGFLHVSDLHPQYFPGAEEEEKERIGKKTPRRDRPPIQRCLKRGQEIFVQVIKEGISTKGPTLTSYLSIPGRYVVMLPFMDKIGVSRKVEDDDERKALRQVLDQIDLPKGFGFIGRTAGIGKTRTEIKRDLAYLQRLWKDIERRHKSGKGPRLLYAESDLLMRVLRDVWTTDIEEIVIDNESAVKRADRFLKIMAPRTETRLAYYDEPRPIFHAFGLEKQIEQVFARQVPLPSGGYLVFDEAEALIAIDVNSGKSRSAGDAESNAYNTNKEAVEEICRQLKLRDVGGLVLMDLIDMMHRSHRRDIEKLMTERLKRDRAATRFLPISDFGIMEMTRQRFRGSLKSMHFTTCPTCNGRAHVRKPTSLAGGLLRTIANLFAYEKVASVRAEVSPRVATELLTHKRHQIARLEHASGKKFDIIVSEEMGVDHVALIAHDEKGSIVDIDRLPVPRPPKRLSAWEGGLKLSEDWSIDASDERESARQEAMSIIAAEAAMPAESDDDPLLSEDLLSEELVDEALGSDAENASLGRGKRAGGDAKRSPEPDSEAAGKKKRRRRRRRGGRKEGEEGSDSAEDSRHGEGEPSESKRQHAPASDDLHESAGESGRKRRRRRRRRGSRREDGAGEGEATEPRTPAAKPAAAPADGARKRVVVKKVIRRAAASGAAAPASASSSAQAPVAKKVVKKIRKSASDAAAAAAPKAAAPDAEKSALRKKVVKRVAKKAASAAPPAEATAPAKSTTKKRVSKKAAGSESEQPAAKKTTKKVAKKSSTKKSPAKKKASTAE